MAKLFEGMASGKAKAGGKRRVAEGMASGSAVSGAKRRVPEGMASGSAMAGVKKPAPPIPRAKPKMAVPIPRAKPKITATAAKTSSPFGGGIGTRAELRARDIARKRGGRTYEK